MERLNGNADMLVSQWLNEQLADAAALPLDTVVEPLGQLSLSLAAVQDERRTEMEKLITSLVSSIPALDVELTLMMEAAKSLDHNIRTLQSTAPNSNDDALGQIATLAKAKAQMVATRNTLRQAQSWTTLESEFNAMLGESRYEEAVQRLTNARTSLRVLQDAADPTSSFSIQERTELLLRLSDQVESRLVPELQQALAAQDSTATVRYAHLFVQLDRVEACFIPTYLQARASEVLLKWETHATDSINSRIASLSEHSTALLREESTFATSIFVQSEQAAALLFSHILDQLNPSLSECLKHEASTTTADDFQKHLISVWDTVSTTFQSLTDILSRAAQSEASPISLQSQANQGWQSKLLEPFLLYIVDFSQLEASAMQMRLDQAHTTDDTLSSRVKEAASVVKTSTRRCAQFTNSIALATLAPYLDTFLTNVIDHCRQKEEAQGGAFLQETADRIKRSFSNTQGTSGTAAARNMLDDRGESLTQPEWDHFRQQTKTLAVCKGTLQILNQIEVDLAQHLSQVSIAQPSNGVVDFTSPSSCIATSSLNSSALHDTIAMAKRRLAQRQDTLVTDSQDDLVPRSRQALATLARAIHSMQHRLVLTPFTQTDLVVYPRLTIWTSDKRPGLPANEFDLAMPKFSLSPTDQMARIGEAMLNLPRLFEGLADEALLFGLQLHQSAARKKATTTTTQARHAKAFSLVAIHPSIGSNDNDSEDDEATAYDPTAHILTRYLRSLLRAFFSELLDVTLPQFAHLSDVGVSQLAADLEYLSNITSVLWTSSESVLQPYRQCVEMSDTLGRTLVEHRRQATPPTEPIYQTLLQQYPHAFDLIARLRGWQS